VKSPRSALLLLPVTPLAAPPFYFCREQRRNGREHFNFPPAVAGPAMGCTPRWTAAQRVLATSIVLLSHPGWIVVLGRRRATALARELARSFAVEYLIPNAGRDWIISSSTVREFAAEAIEQELAGDRRPDQTRGDLRASVPQPEEHALE
jgi:hypothetical protein